MKKGCSVVNLDGLFHVVVARPLGVLVDVLKADVGPDAGLAGLGVLQRLVREVSQPDDLDVLFVEVPRAAVRDERQAVLLELFVGHVLGGKRVRPVLVAHVKDPLITDKEVLV